MAIRKNREEWDVYNNVFDRFTDKVLQKLQGQGYYDELIHLISLGKEGNVFLAKRGDDFVCVKIYRLQTCDFNRMVDYLKSDPLYANFAARRREVIFAWAQKEYRNLITLYENKVKVPKPLTCEKHVLVMEFIGDNEGNPAKQLLKEYPENLDECMNTIINYMKQMHKLKMVHGDLSEYNILIKDDKPVIIDVSQTTSSKNLNFNEYLERDCKNIARFCKKVGVEYSKEDILQMITQ